MPSDKQPLSRLMAERVQSAYLRVYGVAYDAPEAQITYVPFAEGYLACHLDSAAGVNPSRGGEQ